MVHGGDEVTRLFPDHIQESGKPLPSNHTATQAYLRNAHDVKESMLKARLYFARAAGNHDPIKHMDEMGFNRASHVFGNRILPHTNLIVCQPKIYYSGSKLKFSYDPDQIISLIDESSSPNLIITSHWAFDRNDLGISEKKEHSYEDTTAPIKSYLEQKICQGKLHSVVTLHGHSHRFRLSDESPMDILTMPAITQNDVDMPEFPCGLFSEIEEDTNSGELTVAFKRIRLMDLQGHSPVIQNVTRAEMDAYSRGRKNHGTGLRFCRQ